MLEQNIQMALSKNDISLEDAIDIREVRNLKMANQLLKLKRKRKQDADREAAAMKQQMTAQTQFQSQKMASDAAMQKIQLEGEMKMREKQAEVAFEIEKLKNEASLKQQLMTYEFQLNMQLKGIQEDAINKRENKREEAKSERISQQNTEQSKLIQTRFTTRHEYNPFEHSTHNPDKNPFSSEDSIASPLEASKSSLESGKREFTEANRRQHFTLTNSLRASTSFNPPLAICIDER